MDNRDKVIEILEEYPSLIAQVKAKRIDLKEFKYGVDGTDYSAVSTGKTNKVISDVEIYIVDKEKLQIEIEQMERKIDKIECMINSMPKKYAEVIYMKYLNEDDNYTISAELDIHRNTVTSYHDKAINRLVKSDFHNICA